MFELDPDPQQETRVLTRVAHVEAVHLFGNGAHIFMTTEKTTYTTTVRCAEALIALINGEST